MKKNQIPIQNIKDKSQKNITQQTKKTFYDKINKQKNIIKKNKKWTVKI